MQALLYSHIFLALCTVAMTLQTIMLQNIWGKEMGAYLLLVFFATILTYNIKGLYLIVDNQEQQLSDKLKWAKANKKILVVLCLIAVIGIIVLSINIQPLSLYILIPLGVVSIAYSLPLKIFGYTISPRKVPYMKAILVSSVWLVVTVILPCLLGALQINIIWLVEGFLFLTSLSILFDIKDIHKDQHIGIKTLVHAVGPGVTKMISVVLMGGRLLLLLIADVKSIIVLEAGCSFLCLIFIINLFKIDRHEKFYMMWIDGLMLGRFIVFSVINYWY